MAEPTEAKIVFAPGPARRIAVDGDDAPQQVVNLERTGDMGSSLAMIRDGQLMLASGSANLDERQYKFDLEWRDCEVKFTSCAFPDRTITAHINNLTVDGDQSTSPSIIWWQFENLPGDSSRKRLYVTDENDQSLYFYIWRDPHDTEQKHQFLLGRKCDPRVVAADIFQIDGRSN